MQHVGRSLVLVSALLAVACASPTSPRSSSPSSGQPVASAPEPIQTLVTAVRYEPVSLASKPLRATGSTADFTVRLFNAELVLRDARNTPLPYLAESLPKLNTESWRVFPDGKMETTYRLKPDLTWHDGTALTADDFVFAWSVYTWADLGLSGAKPQNLMEEVSNPDSRTVVIRWRGPYPEAGDLAYSLFQPLPRQILDTVFRQGDPEGFVNHPYWGVQYVGAGPYRLDRWEPGSLIEASAFAGHTLGKPKIGRMIVRFFTDENTALTNVLSEQVHLAMDRALRYEHTGTLKQEWTASRKGTVVLTPTQWRYVNVQMRPTVVDPRALLDVRTRQALAHTIDKDGLNALFSGEGAMADTLLPRNVPYFAELDRAVIKYPHDPARSQQLMAEVGYTKGSDGIYANSAGERFTFEFRGDSGSQFEKDLAVVGDGWHRTGFDPQQLVIPAAQFRDAEYRVGFKGVYSTTTGSAQDTRLENFSVNAIPTAETRWLGTNYGSWSNAEFNRLWMEFSTTLDRTERDRQVIQMLRLVSEDVAIMPLFHNFEVAAHYATLTGPDPNPVYFGLIEWNVHEWQMR